MEIFHKTPPMEHDPKMVIATLCTEDLRRSLWPRMQVDHVAHLIQLLLSAKGKTIKDVVVDDSLNTDIHSPEYNPCGTLIRVKLITE